MNEKHRVLFSPEMAEYLFFQFFLSRVTDQHRLVRTLKDEHAARGHRGSAGAHRSRKILHPGRTAASHQGDAQDPADLLDQGKIVSPVGAVVIDRIEEKLAGACILHLFGEGYRLLAGVFPSVPGEYLILP